MVRLTSLAATVAFVASLLLLFVTWQFQRRTLEWRAVPVEVTSSEIANFRKKSAGRMWSATVDYSISGVEYTKTIHNLPFGATEIYVDPNDPTNVVGQRGATARGLFLPIGLSAATGLFGLVLILIKLSPSD